MNYPRLLIKSLFIIAFLCMPHFVFAATITVNSNSFIPGTDGLCTLPEAINNANSDGDGTGGDCSAGSGTDTIAFSTPMTISPTSTLSINSPVVIDGTLNGVGTCIPKSLGVVLDATILNSGGVFYIENVADVTIKGLVISGGVNTSGISAVNTTNLTVTCNIIGFAADGVTASTVKYGVIINGGSDNTIGGTNVGDGNVILGSEIDISTLNDTGLVVQGNYLGVDATGLASPNLGKFGVMLYNSTDVQIGGSTVETRNVISGHMMDDYATAIITNGPVDAVTIQGNYIGTDKTGNTIIGNKFAGITICGEVTCGHIPGDLATNITIGGASAGEGNVFGGNGNAVTGGQAIDVASATNVVIQGNSIGVGVDGVSDIGNRAGISFADNNGFIIGGDTAAERNIIGNNDSYGIISNIANTGPVTISGNYIGFAADGLTAADNSESGVYIDGGTGVVIGGDTAAERNIIGNSASSGIVLKNTVDAVVSGNYIGLGADGATVGSNIVGVTIEGGSGTVLGGSLETERNIISGNSNIQIQTVNSPQNVSIKNNYIGTTATGLVAATVIPMVAINIPDAVNVHFGGTGTYERNIVVGGVVNFAGINGLIIENSYFGITADGLSAPGFAGMTIQNNTNVLFGGTTTASANYFGGDGTTTLIPGVFFFLGNNGVIVQNNVIGVLPDGITSSVANFDILTAFLNEPNTLIKNNTIISSAAALVGIMGGSVALSQNSFYSLTSAGGTAIDLVSSSDPDGVPDSDIGPNTNDYLDSDLLYYSNTRTYANDFLNHPILISAEQSGLDAVVTYMLDVPAAAHPYQVEFFTNPHGFSTTGFGYGEVYKGNDTQVSSGTGPQLFTTTLSNVNVSDGLVANVSTCADAGCTAISKTSEFSNGIIGTGGIDMGTASGTQTELSDNGPYHIIKSGISLGASVEADVTGPIDTSDRDGVLFDEITYLPNGSVTITVSPNHTGYLNVWFDTNANGSFSDSGEHIVSNQSVLAGQTDITTTAPANVGTYPIRFRFTSYEPVAPAPTGEMLDGEVEDYVLTVVSPTQGGGIVSINKVCNNPIATNYTNGPGVGDESVCSFSSTMATVTPSNSSQFVFPRVLKFGMRGEDVRLLQQYLNTHGFPVALTGVGSISKETTYFGLATKKALVAFQEAHAVEILKPLGLTKGTGVLGSATKTLMK